VKGIQGDALLYDGYTTYVKSPSANAPVLEEGFTQKQLDEVHSPVGIDIGAETPEEIAISIIAELIKERVGA